MKFSSHVSIAASAVALIAAGSLSAQSPGPGLMVTAKALVDEPLVDGEGRTLGTLKQVFIDAETGRVRYVAVELDERTVAIPWEHLDIDGSGRTRLDAPIETLRDAPVLDGARLDASTHTELPLGRRAVTTTSGVMKKIFEHTQTESSEREALKGIVLATDELEVRVLLAPAAYLEESGIHLEDGEWLEVEGVQVVLDGEPTMVAYEVRIDGETLRLREPDGAPLWREPRP